MQPISLYGMILHHLKKQNYEKESQFSASCRRLDWDLEWILFSRLLSQEENVIQHNSLFSLENPIIQISESLLNNTKLYKKLLEVTFLTFFQWFFSPHFRKTETYLSWLTQTESYRGFASNTMLDFCDFFPSNQLSVPKFGSISSL